MLSPRQYGLPRCLPKSSTYPSNQLRHVVIEQVVHQPQTYLFAVRTFHSTCPGRSTSSSNDPARGDVLQQPGGDIDAGTNQGDRTPQGGADHPHDDAPDIQVEPRSQGFLPGWPLTRQYVTN